MRLFAVLRERAGRDRIVLTDVPVGSTVAELKALVAAEHPELGPLESVAGVVGTSYARPETVVNEGDEVALLPPVSGGAPTEDELLKAGLFELDANPLDVAALHSRVSHPSCGAIVVFTGTTRATNRGRDVTRLDYEAFEEMAEPEMRRIFDDCLRAYGPPAENARANSGEVAVDRTLRMLCVHRTGTVEVGEPSVVIAVASPHRDAAFLAARFLIDTLKERLPVWKKEVYAGGHHWIGDRS